MGLAPRIMKTIVKAQNDMLKATPPYTPGALSWLYCMSASLTCCSSVPSNGLYAELMLKEPKPAAAVYPLRTAYEATTQISTKIPAVISTNCRTPRLEHRLEHFSEKDCFSVWYLGGGGLYCWKDALLGLEWCSDMTVGARECWPLTGACEDNLSCDLRSLLSPFGCLLGLDRSLSCLSVYDLWDGGFLSLITLLWERDIVVHENARDWLTEQQSQSFQCWVENDMSYEIHLLTHYKALSKSLI